MCASVSVSSGSMCTKCEDVQQAVQPSHGTSASRSPRRAACMAVSQAEKSPAARSSSPSLGTAPLYERGGDEGVAPVDERGLVAVVSTRGGGHGTIPVVTTDRALTVTDAATRLR